VLHKHHPIIPIGAGLIQFVYDLRSRLANSGYPSEKSISAIFRTSFVLSPATTQTLPCLHSSFAPSSPFFTC